MAWVWPRRSALRRRPRWPARSVWRYSARSPAPGPAGRRPWTACMARCSSSLLGCGWSVAPEGRDLGVDGDDHHGGAEDGRCVSNVAAADGAPGRSRLMRLVPVSLSAGAGRVGRSCRSPGGSRDGHSCPLIRNSAPRFGCVPDPDRGQAAGAGVALLRRREVDPHRHRGRVRLVRATRGVHGHPRERAPLVDDLRVVPA